MTDSSAETNFNAFLTKLNGTPGCEPFCTLFARLAGAVRREIGGGEDVVARHLVALGLAPARAEALAASIPAIETCAERCEALTKDWLLTRESLHALVGVKETLDAAKGGAPEEAAAAQGVSDLLADLLAALDALMAAAGGIPRLTTAEVVLRHYADFLLGKAEEPSLYAEDPWLAAAEKYFRLSEAPGELPRRYVREFVSPLSMQDRREISDAIFIVTEMTRDLKDNPRLYERALKAAGRTDLRGEIDDAGELLIDIYYASIEHLLLNVSFPKPALSRREEQQAATALGDRLAAAAGAVTGETRARARDAFRASGLMVELLRTLKPGEFQKLVLQLPMKRRAQAANALVTMTEASHRLDEEVVAAARQ